MTRAWPGVLWPRREGMRLSWFYGPVYADRQTALRSAIEHQLVPAVTWSCDAQIEAWMQQTLQAGTAISGARRWTADVAAGTAVLVFDQRRFASPAVRRALLAALEGHADVWVWPCADGRGWLQTHRPPSAGARWCYLPVGLDLADLLRQVGAAYTAEADEGWLALLAGTPLHVFGAAHYAGWGLSLDHGPATLQGSRRLSLRQLFELVYVRLAHYRDPEGGGETDLPGLLTMLVWQQQVRRRFADLDQPTALRFQLWKRRFAAPFLQAGMGHVRWRQQGTELRLGQQAVAWGGKPAEDVPAGLPLYRIEDGFLHSCGLGSDMVAPRSQVMDRQRLYFDARGPSDLSDILNHHEFDPALLQRAALLRAQICAAGVTKYNLGRRRPGWQPPVGQRVVLVPGQVADDASIRFGTGRFATAEALLQEVRRRHPQAFIVYKPHPDVLSGNRKGLVEAAQLANVVDTESDVLSLIEASDEVHTLSSLAGFDALLRGRQVVTYGKPFYAGWGLTDDVLGPLAWRDRVLTLDMLVAGALILYPLYWNWRLQLFCTPESVVIALEAEASRPLRLVQRDRLRLVRKVRRWISNAVWFLGKKLIR